MLDAVTKTPVISHSSWCPEREQRHVGEQHSVLEHRERYACDDEGDVDAAVAGWTQSRLGRRASLAAQRQ